MFSCIILYVTPTKNLNFTDLILLSETHQTIRYIIPIEEYTLCVFNCICSTNTTKINCRLCTKPKQLLFDLYIITIIIIVAHETLLDLTPTLHTSFCKGNYFNVTIIKIGLYLCKYNMVLNPCVTLNFKNFIIPL